jgi:ferredoxin
VDVDEKTSTVTLVRDGNEHRVSVGPRQTILEATDDTDVHLRYGCRDGKCGSCTARLLDGDITYTNAPRALAEDQQAAGFVLLCSARPISDCRIAVGRSVLADAFPNLWPSESGTE